MFRLYTIVIIAYTRTPSACDLSDYARTIFNPSWDLSGINGTPTISSLKFKVNLLQSLIPIELQVQILLKSETIHFRGKTKTMSVHHFILIANNIFEFVHITWSITPNDYPCRFKLNGNRLSATTIVGHICHHQRNHGVY
jgi:hypothetical protein